MADGDSEIPPADPVRQRFIEALRAHVESLDGYVRHAPNHRILLARLGTWTRDVAVTMRRFGLASSADELRLVTGVRDPTFGEEYLESRPDNLRAFLVDTLRHVDSGRLRLRDPERSPQPAPPEAQHRLSESIGPRQRFRPDRRVIAIPDAPRPDRERGDSRAAGSPPSVNIHIGDSVGGDKNVNSGSGAIRTGAGPSVASDPGAPVQPAPPPTSPSEALAQVVAPPGASPWRRRAAQLLMVVLGVAIAMVATFSALPDSAKEAVLSWFSP